MEQDSSEKVTPSRLLIPAMVIGGMSVSISIIMMQLFLVDIASTFNVPVGVASQLSTFNRAAELVAALVLSVLVVRFRYKPLILAGVLLVLLSAVGGFLAPDFGTMLIFFAMEGFGTIMFSVIAYTVIGDAFPPQRRAKAVSYVMGASMVMALISFPLSGFLAKIAGWRSNFVLQTLPVALVGFALALLTISPKLRKQATAGEKASIVKSFKQVLKDKSATACLVAKILSGAGSTFPIFLIAFFRERFSVTLEFTVLVAMINFSTLLVGSLIAGRLASKFGAKPIAVFGALSCGVSAMIFFFIPDLWVALVFGIFMAGFGAIAMTADTCLALAQVPESRGTMMSLKGALDSVGGAIGPAVGGALLVLTLELYGSVGLALGGMLVLSAAILFFWAKETDRA